MTVIEQALAIREAMDIAGAVLGDEKALECVRLYRAWKVGTDYKKGDFFTFGVNGVGDPQLYKVNLDHTSQAVWLPGVATSLYTAIGLDANGYPVWSRPTGAHDAYNTGDIVNYNGMLCKSLMDGNTYSPEEYPAGWEVYNG